jgi:hypothetical protein
MEDNEFKKLMLEIIKDVFEEKNEKHFIYNKNNKLEIGKYLLGRLIRESYRIFYTAQKKATLNCPYKKVLLDDGNVPDKSMFH